MQILHTDSAVRATEAEMIEVSIVIPCLNEAETLEIVVEKALRALADLDVRGEVIVADNGSTDGSQQLARAAGARVVDVPVRGYGAALIGGINAAQGDYVIMGDADDSYDFSAIEPFIGKLRAGYDLVMGTRLKGEILPGAMPNLHRYLGNPVLTLIGNVLFRTNISDYHCGLRGFNRKTALALGLRTTGMEFATELVAKMALNQRTMTEIPIIYRPDGRTRRPHLRTWSDGWRHLKFMLLLSPVWVFVYPGMVLTALGVIGLLGVLLTPIDDVNPFGRALALQLIAVIAVIIGAQLLIFGVLSRLYADKMGLLQPTPFWDALQERLSLDTGLMVGGVVVAGGIAAILVALSVTDLRLLIVGLLALVLGTKLIFLSFVVSLIRIKSNFES